VKHAHFFLVALAVGGCIESTNPPVAAPVEENPPKPQATAESAPVASEAPPSSKDALVEYTPEMVARATHDPTNGNWTLAQATAGLSGSGPLVATITTNMGAMKCTLDPQHAPLSVANFVGLARGKRPWKSPEGAWVLRPAYDNTSFHRIIKGFMIQGGDPTGTGTGEPGYTIKDERWAGARHDRPGLLCMANRGPDTNGMQFFIMDANTPHLDSARTSYTIFGSCEPVEVVHAIANVPVGVADRPTQPVTIESITIAR